MIQFKLSVNLSGEVTDKVNDGKAPQIEVKARTSDIYSTMKGNVADKMLRDTREESKEKTEKQKAPGITKGYMEDIKEQDSEAESNRNHPQLKQDISQDSGQIQAKIKVLSEKKNKLQAQLT